MEQLDRITSLILNDNDCVIKNEHVITRLSQAIEDKIEDIILQSITPIKVINDYILDNEVNLAYLIISDELIYGQLPENAIIVVETDDIHTFSKEIMIQFNSIETLESALLNKKFTVICDEDEEKYYLFFIDTITL